MKSTGIVRKVDTLGRIVVPKKLRREFEIHEYDFMELYVEGDQVAIEKYLPACIFCDSTEGIVMFHEHPVCAQCQEALLNMVKGENR